MNRREIIKVMGAGLASVYFGGCASLAETKKNNGSFDDFSSFSPIDRTLGAIAPLAFSGDMNPERIHKVLWDKRAYLKSIKNLPPPSEFVDVVVVGGGMSGILSTYFLRKHNVVLLEQASRFGGNSRGESWEGIDYSLATAYTDVPEKGTPIDTFFTELGLQGKFRIHSESDAIVIDNKKYTDIWVNGTNSKNKSQFTKLNTHFSDMASESNGLVYPELPALTVEGRKYANKLDKMSFKEYVENILGEPLHPHVDHVFENYFWSAAACSSSEISAAAGLYFFVGDFSHVAVFPGGNGAIAETTLKAIMNEVPQKQLRPSSLVFDVRVEENGVNVSYIDKHNNPKTIRAKTVVMSCPKFVVGKLIDDLEPRRLEVIKKQKYRSYLVANLLINKNLPDNFYDLFTFASEEMKIRDTREAALAQKVTDFVYGNYTKPNLPRSVLTLFRGIPYDDARKEIYGRDFYAKARKEFETQINENILPLLNLTKNDVADLRLTRWGHPLPVFQVGNLRKGYVDVLRKPFKERVFFVEQDNWTLPSFESAFAEAQAWTPHVINTINGYPLSLRKPSDV